MTPPESEWMLWAKRTRDSIRRELDEDLQALPTRYASIVQDTTQLDSLKKQVQDLSARTEGTNQTMQSFHDRIQKLENEATLRAQENTTHSEWLQDTARDVARQLEHAVGAHEQFKREARATAAEQQRLVMELKEHVEVLKQGTGEEQQGIAASKTLSEATTLDVSSNIGLEFPDSQIPQHDNLKISQGKATYEAYVNASESFVRAAVRQTEIRAVKAVLTGLKQAFRRKEILKVLEEKGCFWSIAKQELQKIVDEGKRRRATRRTVHLAPLKDLETSSSRPTDPSSELLGGQ